MTSTTFRTGEFAGELEASENIGIFDVAGDTAVEDIADAEVHDDLGGVARIDAAEQRRRRILSRSACPLFPQIIAFFPFAFSKALVSVFHRLNDLIRRQLVAQLLGQGVCAGLIREEEAAAAHSNRGRTARHHEKIPPSQAIAVCGMFGLVMHRRSSSNMVVFFDQYACADASFG